MPEQSSTSEPAPQRAGESAASGRIWWFAFGYFACYVPYSALTKLLSDGELSASRERLDGFALLPISTSTSLVGMLVFLTWAGWWRHAGQRKLGTVSIPCPGGWTFLSGLATAAIIATTTLAYTFSGISIVFMMLLMRGGVLVMAPLIDAISKRKVNLSSWIALGLSLGALAMTVRPGIDGRMTLVAALDVAAYLTGYFLRLRFMSRLAKRPERTASIRYFVEEQMVATPAIVLVLGLVALLSSGPIGAQLRWGFVSAWSSDVLAPLMLVGLLSQGTGIFGALLLLDARSNVFCVAVNRASSVLAGALASTVLWLLALGKPLKLAEILGAVLLMFALALLAFPPRKPKSAIQPIREKAQPHA